ncbi:MAG: glucosamine-6-phosphate deaminase [Clostridia bacterium]|nr:glucosamine-6-phosphate deaminase [Clostridia bacterium]
MIKIIYGKTAYDAGINGADVITALLQKKKNAVLGLATGSSPIGMYTELIARYKSGEISFADVKSVNLDEYVGLSADHDQSYSYFMHHNLFNHVDIKEENTNLPNGLAADPKAECERYDAVVASMGGVDIQVLGIGNNGHIGFNEPDVAFSKGTGLVDLTDSTIDANARFFAKREDVPTQALSMGVGQIMNADKVLLLAMGKGKADILEKSLFGPVTPSVPASILQFFKGEVIVCADEDALSVIMEKHPEAVQK